MHANICNVFVIITMRVLLLLDFFSSLGGVEYYNFQLITNLLRHNYHVKIVIGERPRYPYWVDLLNKLDVDYICPDEFHNDLKSRSIEKTLIQNHLQHILEWKPDLIFAHPAGKTLITFPEAYPLSSIPVVVTEYTTPGHETESWFCAELPNYINRIDVIIATCQSVADGVRNYHRYVNEIQVIPHIIPDTAGWIGNEGMLNSIGYIGRLSPEKGLDFLLGAWKKVNGIFPDATLHIYGHGEDEGHLKALAAALGISKTVYFEGVFMPIFGIDEVARRHRIFVQPSLFESIPTTLLELLSRKRAVIASAVGGIPEIISNEDKSGLLVTPASTDELSEAILYLLSNSSVVSELGLCGHQKFSKTYNYESNLNSILNLLKAIHQKRKDL